VRKNNSKQTARSREKKGPKARPDGTTFVSVTNKGFPGSETEAAQLALDATEGFAFVLAGGKALLELDVELNLVPDRFPDGIGKQ